jgi:hypothetical protein
MKCLKSRLSTISSAVLLGVTLIASSGLASAAPSTELNVFGAVNNPRTFTLPGLEAFPPVTQTVSFSAGGVPETHTYTGADLWTVLGSSRRRSRS